MKEPGTDFGGLVSPVESKVPYPQRGGIMKERPIICTGESVLGILEDRKRHTRRVVKNQPPNWAIEPQPVIGIWCGFHGDIEPGRPAKWTVKCPYGQVGDRLWVRETWFLASTGAVFYRADGNELENCWSWRSPIYMPRRFSRITLEITELRVERLQNITREDAIAEGVDWKRCPAYQTIEDIEFTKRHLPAHTTIDYIGGYRRLWDSINKKRGYGWKTNPWVWVIDFKRINP
jgi:hypothetical protein